MSVNGVRDMEQIIGPLIGGAIGGAGGSRPGRRRFGRRVVQVVVGMIAKKLKGQLPIAFLILAQSLCDTNILRTP